MARDELVAIVDEENRVTGSAPRWVMRRDGLLHRATYVFVFDPAGLLYVQLRTPSKDVYPGYWDLAAGGVVLHGESYAQGAERELEEELGIHGVPLEEWFPFYFEDGSSRVFGAAYGCVYDGPLRLQAEEVVCVERLRVEDILSGATGRRFTPDSLLALRRRMLALNDNLAAPEA
ncbi:MAG: NUDIX hydrolase YfcD [Bryobacterales bacterium]|nr:NUDIX hydrolase YfcD [Bryobacterales bacterium]